MLVYTPVTFQTTLLSTDSLSLSNVKMYSLWLLLISKESLTLKQTFCRHRKLFVVKHTLWYFLRESNLPVSAVRLANEVQQQTNFHSQICPIFSRWRCGKYGKVNWINNSYHIRFKPSRINWTQERSRSLG